MQRRSCERCKRPQATAVDWSLAYAAHGGVPPSDSSLCWRALGILLQECDRVSATNP